MKKVILTICVASVVLTAQIGFCAKVKVIPKQPKGFRFNNGQLLTWGASKDRLIAILPGQLSETPDELEAETRKYSQCSAEFVRALQKSVEQGTASPDSGLCDPYKPDVQFYRVVWCSNQPEFIDNPLFAKWKDTIDRAAGGDGCVVSSIAMPVHYGHAGHDMSAVLSAPAVLAFNRDRFFRITIIISTEDFDEIARSLNESLGKPKKRAVGTTQNGMGALFDTVDDTWRVGSVLVNLSKRAGEVDKGGFEMTYLPLAKNAPKPPVAPPPF